MLAPPARLEGYSGEVQLDEAEVAAVEWVALPELRRRAEAQPGQFTQVTRAGCWRGRLCWHDIIELLKCCRPHHPVPWLSILGWQAHPSLRFCVLQWFLDEVRSLSWFEAHGRQGAAAAGQTAAGRVHVGPSQASEQLMTSA